MMESNGLEKNLELGNNMKKTLRELLSDVYNLNDLTTTCCRQCTCCRVACPQMHYSEACQMLDGNVFQNWSRKDKKELLLTCLKYFFSDSLIKPCPMLDGDGCRVYEDRPLNCRMYGLWPDKTWESRVEGFAKAVDLPREKLPLNQQCPMVLRVNGGALTDKQIDGMFSALEVVDRQIGDLDEDQIDQNWHIRTLHDWILLKFWGEEKLIVMSELKKQSSPEDMPQILAVFEEAAAKMV
jgi:Fe-S-cluster containining protein